MVDTGLLNEYLKKKADDLMMYKMPRNNALMDEILTFDPRNLESTPSAKISQYAIGLSQFLVVFVSQINKSIVLLTLNNRVIDTKVAQSDIKSKTAQEKRRLVILNDPELQAIEDGIELLECEIKMTENVEKYYVELINSFKRELTRRE